MQLSKIALTRAKRVGMLMRQDVFKCVAKEQYNAQVRVAVDRIWEKVVSATDEGRIGLQDLYCAILLVYK